jgi:hypothetical protein
MMMMMKVISELLVAYFYVPDIWRLSGHLITSQLPSTHIYLSFFKFQIISNGFQNICWKGWGKGWLWGGDVLGGDDTINDCL